MKITNFMTAKYSNHKPHAWLSELVIVYSSFLNFYIIFFEFFMFGPCCMFMRRRQYYVIVEKIIFEINFTKRIQILLVISDVMRD